MVTNLRGTVLSVSAVIALLVDVAVLALIAECARLLLFVLPSDHVRVARAVGKTSLRIARLAAEPIALGRAARALRDLEPGDDVTSAVREEIEDVWSGITRRLGLLRLLGPVASCAGLAGAAAQMSWMQQSHGVLDLDPDRVLLMAVEAGSTCMALGIAGSTTAISSLFLFRPRARALREALDRFGEQLVASPPWTSARR